MGGGLAVKRDVCPHSRSPRHRMHDLTLLIFFLFPTLYNDMFCLLLGKGTHQASQSPKRPRDVSNQNKNLSLKGTPADRVAKSATRTVQALISQKSNESLTSDTGEAPPAPCKHPCKDKSTCGHPCCKRGVTRPHILVTPHTNELPPHPVPPTTQQTVPECKHRCKDKAHCEHPCCKRHLVRVAKPDTYNNKRSDAPVDAREDVKVITAVSVMPVQRSMSVKTNRPAGTHVANVILHQQHTNSRALRRAAKNPGPKKLQVRDKGTKRHRHAPVTA